MRVKITLPGLAACIATFAGGALLGFGLRRIPPPVYQRVEVPVERIIEREPDTIVRWRDRIVTVAAAPDLVATAEKGGEAEVEAFCEPVRLVDTLRIVGVDTVHVVDTVPDPRLLLRSVSHDPGWWWGRDQLLLTGPTSAGDLMAFDYQVRPGFTVRTSGDSLLVRYPRTSVLREVVEFGVPVLVGFFVGRASNH